MGEVSPAPMAAAQTPHVLLISFPGQGHVNPVLRLAKRIAAKGLLVTFSSTSEVGKKIAASTGKACWDEGVPVGHGRLRYDFLDDGPVSTDIDELMNHLAAVGPRTFAELLRRQADAGRPVSCVVGNPFIPWVLDVAADAGIPSAVLWVQSCAVFSMYYHYIRSPEMFPSESNPDAAVSLPGLPTLASGELPSFLLPSNPYKLLANAILEQFKSLSKSSWVFVNSFEELERDTLAALSEAGVTPSLVPVGPLTEQETSSVRADLIKAADECVEWLDRQSPRSVAYVSLGSVVVLTSDDMAEMAHGLASTGRPFLWVVRQESRSLLPENFVERIGERGMVVGWSPQDRVLGHAAVGCFLTHCGWNSTLESLAAGVPVVAYPQWGDQVTDAKFLVDVYRTGVRLHAPVTTDAVKAAVEAAMAGPEAAAMQENATAWKEASRAAVAAGGSSDRNVQAFVDELLERTGGAPAA